MGDERIQSHQGEISEPANAIKNAAQAQTPSQSISYGLPQGLRISGGASSDDIPLTRDNLLFLQRTVGNRAVVQLLQRKEGMSRLGDEQGREADRAAEQVVSASYPFSVNGGTSTPQISRAPDRDEYSERQPEIQHQPISGIEQTHGGGEPLPESGKEFFENRFGRDFSRVRIHTDDRAAEAARELRASAFTNNRDIYFAADAYRPDTPEGRGLLAHELTHTIQQSPASAPNLRAGEGPGAVVAPDDKLEREAEVAAGHVAAGRVVPGNAISEGQPGAVGRIARQDQNATPPGQTNPTQGGAAPGVTTQGGQTQVTGPHEVRIETSMRMESQFQGELGLQSGKRVVYERRVHIRTESGAEADLVMRATTDLPFDYDLSSNPEAALSAHGRTEMGYTLIGRLADGTPVTGMGLSNSDDSSIKELAKINPEFTHFDLKEEQQYQAIVDAMRNSVTEQVWRESEEKARERKQSQYPSQEEFKRMTPEEKRELAKKKFWEEFDVSRVIYGILIGAAILVVAVLAVLAAEAGLVVLAGVLLAIAIIATVVGLGFLISAMIRDVGESWRQGDTTGVILQILKYLAIITAIILGAIVLVVAVITAGEVILAGLAIAAIVLLLVAAVLGIILVFHELDQAEHSENVEDFQRHVKQAAHEAEEVIINLVLLIISFILGPLARRYGGGRRGGTSEGGTGKGGEGRPGGPLPDEGQPRIEPPLQREGEVHLQPSRGGAAEPVTLPNGRNGVRLTVPSGESVTAEIISRTRVPEGEVQRVRLPDGQEGEIFVSRDPDGTVRWRLLSPEEKAQLGVGDAVRGQRPRPAGPTDPPRLPDGTIDYAAWEQRLRAKGVRGELGRKIQEARAGNQDSEAELRAAERYIDAGYDVEIVQPVENAGIKNPDLRITYRNRSQVRVDVKHRDPGAPLTRNNLNTRIRDGNNQISKSPEGRGDIIIDASDAAPDSMPPAEVENFLRGKLTGNRFAPPDAAFLKNIEYLEIIYRANGRLNRSYIFRNANGDAQGPFTEVLE